MTKRQEHVLNIALLIVLVILAVAELGFGDQPAVFRTEIYTVQTGDTLWNISETYIQKNTYSRRDIREFYQGIIEGNWQTFENRPPGAIYPGDKLTITWWERSDL
jgi:hypothetical protein